MTQKLLELILFLKVETILNWETIDQYQFSHASPRYLSVLCILAFKNTSLKT